MSTISFATFVNSTLFDALSLYVNNFTTFLSNSVIALRQKETVFTVFENFPDHLYFDEFQWFLLEGFLAILVVNVVLICLAWRFYGKNICERFMKPATSKAIEELKASVSRLKLPKEHTPRI